MLLLVLTNLRINDKCALLILLFLAISCNTRPATEQSVPLTKTPILHPTQTLLPTLSPTEVTKIVTDLYMSNGGCELPCFMGIVPGQTSIQEIYNRFFQIGYFEDQTRVVDTYQHIAFATKISPDGFVSSRNDGRWGFSMRVKNDTIIGFVTGATDIEKFSAPSLSKFLSSFGQPEQLRIRVIESQLIDENPDYEIALYYPSKGIFIRWRGEVKTVLSKTEKGITVLACPQTLPTYSDQVTGLTAPSFYLFSPDETLSFDEIINTHLSEDPSGSYQSLSIPDLQKFYRMYLGTTTQECFPFSYTW